MVGYWHIIKYVLWIVKSIGDKSLTHRGKFWFVKSKFESRNIIK